jgi:hypothetical protein
LIIARQPHSSLEQAGHIASKSGGNLFKNEHRQFSFVICGNPLVPWLAIVETHAAAIRIVQRADKRNFET